MVLVPGWAMFDLTRRSRGWIWGCRLSALDLQRIYCSCLRLSDVDGGEAAGLPYALLLVFLRGNLCKKADGDNLSFYMM